MTSSEKETGIFIFQQGSVKLRLVPLLVDFRYLLVRIRVVFFAKLESRAEAHIVVEIDGVVVEVAVAEARVPRVARAVL